MGNKMKEEKRDREPAIVHLKGNSRTRKHRLAELIAEEAEKEITEYETHHSGKQGTD